MASLKFARLANKLKWTSYASFRTFASSLSSSSNNSVVVGGKLTDSGIAQVSTTATSNTEHTTSSLRPDDKSMNMQRKDRLGGLHFLNLVPVNTKAIFVISKRNYGGKPPYSIKTVTDRVMLVLQLYDKINPEKLKFNSHLINDLGLDSLDHVEVMLALEREFTMEIPDGDAERLMTPEQIVQYICDAEDVFE